MLEVGQAVKCVGEELGPTLLGRVGIIKRIDEFNHAWPYMVDFPNKKDIPCSEEELRVVNILNK